MAIMAAVTLLVKGIEMAIDNFHVTLEEANDALSEASSTYEATQNELKSLQSEVETTSERMKDLQKLADDNTITLAEEAELETLRLQNAELERKIALKEKEAALEGEKVSSASDDVLNLDRSVEDITQQIGGNVQSKTHTEITPTYKKTDILTATQNEIEALREIRDEREELLKDYTDEDEAELSKLDARKAELEEAIQENVATLTEVRNGYLDIDGNLKDGLSATQLKNYREVTEALDEWAYIDLTPTQKDLKMIESYFDGSVSKNAIKERFLDAVESGDDLEDTMDELGLSLDDLNVDNIENLERYFEEIVSSTDEAKKSVQDYAATVSEVEEAFETDNQDNDWSTISEKYKSAKELLKEGKTGTDDFQTMASFLNPKLLKKEAEKNGKYSADAYQKAFEAAQKTANRWFGEDETKSMQNFVSDFKKKGLFDIETDADGLWDISANFETSAEAAEQFGMSIESVETMLHALEAYGYGESLKNIKFSGESLQEYNTYLSQIQETMDSVEDEDLRLQLKAILDEESKTDYEDKIEDLTTEKIQEIKVVADIAQYDAEISKLKAIQENEGFFDTGANAEILGTYETRNNYRYDNFNSSQKKKLGKDKGYDNLEAAENSLTKKIKEANSQEELAEFQKQKLAVEEFKASYLDEFKDSGISWDDFLKTSEAKDTLDEVVDTYGVSKDEIETLFGDEVKVAPIHVEVDANEVEKTLDEAAAGSTVTFTAEIDGQGERTIEALKDEKGNIIYTADIDGVETKVLPFIDPITNEVTYVVVGDEEVRNKSEEVKDSVDSVESNNIEVSQTGAEDTKNKLDNVSDAVNNVPNRVIVTTSISGYQDTKTKLDNLKTKWQEITGSLISGGVASGTMLSPAHKDGTAYNVLNTKPTRAYASGKVGLPSNQKALVNEETINGHSESIVRDGVWRLIPGGAHLENLKKGDLIFSAQQTEDLLRSGKTPGHARAYAQGNVLSKAYRLGDPTSKKNTSTTKKNSSNNNNKSTTTSTDPEEFDWIERKIKAIETAIDKLKSKAEATYKSWSTRNSALTKELKQVKNEISVQEKAYDYYIKKAKSVDLDSKYKKLVKEGKISISSIKDEKLAEKIKKYQDYYDKAQDCKDAVRELNDTVADLAKQKFENVMQEWEDKLSDSEYKIEKLNAQMELLEEQGYEVDESYYKKLIAEENNNIANLKSEKSALKKSLNEAVKNGDIKKNSEAWYEMKENIREVDIEIINGQKDLASYNNELRQIEWDTWQKGHDALEDTRDELETILNLLDGNDLFDEDTGEFTEFGIASQGIHVLKYQSYMDDVKKYANEIKEIQAELNDDPNNTKLQDKYDELIEKQREAAEGAKSEQDAIKDLASEYNDALLDALNKIIDKRKEALEDMSSLLDYERDVTDQTKNIASLEKQLMAAKADKSEAGRAKAQRLQEELDEAKKDLEQTEYDKWTEDQEKMLDNLATDYEDFLSNRLEDTEKLISEAVDATKNASADIRKTLAELASSYGIELSDDLQSLLKTDAEKKAEETVKDMIPSLTVPETTPSEPTKVEDNIGGSSNNNSNKNNSNKNNSNGSSKWGSWFIKKKYSGKKTKSSTSITERLKYFGFDNSFSARAKYYEAMGLGKKSSYKGTAAQNTAMIKAMKKNGYKDGGTIGKLIKRSGEDGFVLARTGEEILSRDKIERMKDLMEQVDSLANLSNMATVGLKDALKENLSSVATSSGSIGDIRIDIGDIYMEGVNNPEEFAVQMRQAILNDKRTKKILQSQIVGEMYGKNSLNKFKY